MMMRCLEAGGLEPAFDSKRDKRLKSKYVSGSYVPNERFYEFENEVRLRLLPHRETSEGITFAYDEGYLESDEFHQRFMDLFEGKLLKLINPWLWTLPPKAKAKIVYMTRNPEEIRNSYYRFTGEWFNDAFVSTYERKVDQITANLRRFRTVQMLDYADVLFDPEASFGSLSWPINSRKAASIVDSNLYRSHAA